MAEGLKQYKGSLNPAQIAFGINVARKNARRLYEDAHLLFDNARYPSSLALAILSIEESGKASILRSLSLSRDGKEIKDSWRRYRSHKDKNAHWIAIDLCLRGREAWTPCQQLRTKGSGRESGIKNREKQRQGLGL